MAIYYCILMIIMLIMISDTCQNYVKQCHDFYDEKGIICTEANYSNIECRICTDAKSNNVTVCEATQPNQVFETVPVDTTKMLIIKYNNTWDGYLPLQTDPIDLTGIGRLENLKYFELENSDNNFFQLYPLMISTEAIKNLTNLIRLRIRVPVADTEKPSISDIVKNLPNLNMLDLSYTRGLGLNSIINILNNLNNTSIQFLCLRKYQLVGATEYTSNFASVLKKVKYKVFPNLKELDLSENTFARMPPGITTLAPQLKRYDISGNLLLDTRNMAVLLEAFMHPNIEELNVGHQGYAAYNPDPFYTWAPTIFQKYHNSPLTHTYPANTKMEDKQDSSNRYQNRQSAFLLDCINNVTHGNISRLPDDEHGRLGCYFTQCILPSFFSEIDCDAQTFMPSVINLHEWDCMFFMNFPIGSNLKRFYFSHIHLEQSGMIGIVLNGKLCLRENNLTTVAIDGNEVWMEAAKIGQTFKGMTGIQGFENIVNLSLSNNSIKFTVTNTKSDTPFTGILPSLKTLDLSGNKLRFDRDMFQLCNITPNIETLKINNCNLTSLSSTFFKNCGNLKILEMADNNLNNEWLNTLDFSNFPNLTILNLQTNRLHYLHYDLIRQFDTMPQLMIDISNNPLWCNCSNIAITKNFTMWLNKTQVSVYFINFQHYYCHGPVGFEFIHNINPAIFWNSCYPTYSLKTVIISATSTLAATLLFAIMVCLYRVRWRLRYYIYKAQQLCKGCFSLKSSNKDRHIWRYDAFISYCSQDRFWVHDTLMKTLENKYGFRLCIHYRDFPAGGGIAETISERMNQSREIVIVISEIALKSEWCNFELDEALLQIHRRNMRLIIIKLGKLKTHLLNSKLAHILDSHTFLEWSDNKKRHKLFWASLVGLLYDNPYGGYTCCCPYGARSIGYKDIIDPQDTECEEEIEHLPRQVKEPWTIAHNAKTAYKKAKRFRETLEEVLKEEELPQWSYGPIPVPIGQLLRHKEDEINDQVYHHAYERVKLLIQCLVELEEQKRCLYTTNMEEFKQLEAQIVDQKHVVNIDN